LEEQHVSTALQGNIGQKHDPVHDRWLCQAGWVVSFRLLCQSPRDGSAQAFYAGARRERHHAEELFAVLLGASAPHFHHHGGLTLCRPGILGDLGSWRKGPREE
jgi:hypothetical protein